MARARTDLLVCWWVGGGCVGYKLCGGGGGGGLELVYRATAFKAARRLREYHNQNKSYHGNSNQRMIVEINLIQTSHTIMIYRGTFSRLPSSDWSPE